MYKILCLDRWQMAAVLLSGLCAGVMVAPAAHGATAPAATINIAALGSGGGVFCDLTRKNLIDCTSPCSA